MSQRDAARATSATTARPTAPGPEQTGGVTRPDGAVPRGGATRAGEPRPVDQRAAARAGLAAGRSPSLWWVSVGVVAVLVVTFAVDVTAGALVLAGLLAVSALARAVLRPGPVALSVRSRATDCTVLAVLAVGVGLLAQLAPTG